MGFLCPFGAGCCGSSFPRVSLRFTRGYFPTPLRGETSLGSLLGCASLHSWLHDAPSGRGTCLIVLLDMLV